MTPDRSHRPRALGTRLALVAALAAGAAACTTGTAATPSLAVPSAVAVAPSGEPSATTQSSEPSASSSPEEASAEPTAVPTALDPCQLLTQDEASQLAGVSFGPGKEDTNGKNTKLCTYGGNTKNVLTVVVAQAPDVATAKAQEAKAKQDIEDQAQSFGVGKVKTTELPGFATDTDAVLIDGTADVGGQTLGGRALYLLKGATFFGFSDLALNQEPPSDDAIKAQAMTSLGRIP
jgi:hypothetical protein